MKKHLLFKLLALFVVLITSINTAWADGSKGFFDKGMWQIKLWDGGSDYWTPDAWPDNGGSVDLGTKTTLYLKGCKVNTWAKGDWTTTKCRVYYWIHNGDAGSNYLLTYSSECCSNRTWTWDKDGSNNSMIDYNVIGAISSTPGNHTLKLKWKLDEADGYQSSECNVNFTYPGFTDDDFDADVNTATVNSSSSTFISFGQHYGTALSTTSTKTFSGADAGLFSVTSISETGVTIRFAPTTAGIKTARLTITDAHSKTCIIDLTGKTQYTVTYGAGDYATESNQTANKVFEENLTLADKGYFTRTGYHQTAWNTNSAGTGGTSYSLNGTYEDDAAITLYPTWTANDYTIAFDPNDDNYVGTATGSTASIDATYGTSYTLTSNGFSRAGYTFAGWTANADGTGTEYTDAQTGVSNLTSTNEGTVTLYAKWTPLTYTVQLNYGDQGLPSGQPTSRTVTMGETYASAFDGSTMPTPGWISSRYRFVGWFTLADGGSQITDETIVTTAANHTIYARYIEITYVYFYNNMNWENVYVAFDATWHKDKDGKSDGAGATGTQLYTLMNHIDDTPIWYYEVPTQAFVSWQYNIAFNNTNRSSDYAFSTGEAIYRSDFDSYARMFVPYNKKDDGFHPDKIAGVTYYSTIQYDWDQGRYERGYWMVYNDAGSRYGDAGYVMKGGWDSWNNDYYFRRTETGSTEYTVTRHLKGGSSYTFRIYKHCKTSNTHGSWFIYDRNGGGDSKGGHITSSNCTNLSISPDIVINEDKYNTIETTIEGDYTFTLNCNTDGTLTISVKYPELTTDGNWFRVLYNDGTSTRVCQTFKRIANGGDEWFQAFVHSATDKPSRSMKVQKYQLVSSTPTWSDVHTIDLSGVKETGVHSFIFTRTSGDDLSSTYKGKYDGPYYLRSDVTDGGWDKYLYLGYGDQTMTYSDFSTTQPIDPYSHYYCLYVKDDGTSTSDIYKNVGFTVATSNSPSICDTLYGDAIIGDDDIENLYKHLPSGNPANIRFMYNENTNVVKRAYLKSAQGSGNKRYLVLHGDAHVFDSNGDAIPAEGVGDDDLKANELLFEDKGNWIYEISLKASPIAKAKVMAKYNGDDRYLVGSADTWKTILGAAADDLSNQYDLEGTYDFKTNRLLLAWTPDPETPISTALSDIDMLWVRVAGNPATQIRFTGDGALSNLTVVGAIRFDYSDIVGKVYAWNDLTRPYLKYLLSFPFDVNVSDIFGLNGSKYGREYIIQKYNGAKRAKDGLYLADGVSFWENLTEDSVMHANEGYLLMMDNDYINDAGHSMWKNKTAGSHIYLYFPATDKIASITGTAGKTTTVTAHQSTRDVPYETADGNKYNMKDTDSHWNLIGSPYFSNAAVDLSATSTLKSYYQLNLSNEWDPYLFVTTGNKEEDDKYVGISNNFNAMSCFMVQWHGTATWNSVAPVTPSPVIARRENAQNENYKVILQIVRNDEAEDRAFVELQDGAGEGFVLCEDMIKAFNRNRTNLYVYSDDYAVAYSQVPMETQTVRVGVDIIQNGNYTFRMPRNFSGTVTLVDSFAQTRTNLNLDEYEVYLERGYIRDRFYLEFNIQQTTTSLENTNGHNVLNDGGVHKFIQNDQMYILKNGVIYDARGNRIK